MLARISGWIQDILETSDAETKQWLNYRKRV